MRNNMKRWSLFGALFVVLALALPAAAQVAPGQPGQPVQPGQPGQPGQPSQPRPEPRQPERCVAAGLALAVLSQDGTVADILGAGDNRATQPQIGASRQMTIVVDAPTAVGACADFQAFWGPAKGGKAAAKLAIFNAPMDNASPALASDGADETRALGPATFSKKLHAVTKVDQPGTYNYVAVLEVSATPDGGQAVTDGARVPFTVVFRAQPKPGAIEGTVYGSDGKPLAGAQVTVDPVRTAIGPRPPFAGMPIEGPIVLGAAAELTGREAQATDGQMTADGIQQDQDQAQGGRGNTNAALTDANGHYRIVTLPGKYAASAEAKDHKAQWYNGKDNARDADPVEVQAEATTSGIDFHLVAGGRTPNPGPRTPVDMGTITGLVTDEGGLPLEGATVIASSPVSSTRPGNPPFAAEPISADPNQPNQWTAAELARTGKDGRFELKVAVGKYIVSANSDGGFAMQWFDGQAEAKNATQVEVTKDGKVENVNFRLAKLPQAIVSGKVTKADGTVPKGAYVRVAQRDAAGKLTDARLPAGYRTSARVADDGTYRLIVPPGQWIVGAAVAATLGARGGQTLWWDQKTKPEEADLLDLADGAARSDINFQFQ